MKKKLCAALLSVCIALSLFSSCAEPDIPDVDYDEETEAETKATSTGKRYGDIIDLTPSDGKNTDTEGTTAEKAPSDSGLDGTDAPSDSNNTGTAIPSNTGVDGTTAPAPSYTMPSNASSGLTYLSNGDGTCKVTGIGTCRDKNLVIPPYSPSGDIVRSIGEEAFVDSTITSVVIPDSVTSVEPKVFLRCKSLVRATIPDSMTSIGDSMFFACGKLTTVNIPNSITVIDDGAFATCESLNNITIPNSVTRIGVRAFNGCESLTSIVIPNSVTSLGDTAFCYCPKLVEITLPDSLTSIPESTFYNCYALERVTIPASVTEIGSLAFWCCKKLTTIIYKGTAEQWSAIPKGSQWDGSSGNYRVQYINGDVSDQKDPIPEGACQTCKGTGTVLCRYCGGTTIASNGSYFIRCPYCTTSNQLYTCTDCRGTGKE